MTVLDYKQRLKIITILIVLIGLLIFGGCTAAAHGKVFYEERETKQIRLVASIKKISCPIPLVRCEPNQSVEDGIGRHANSQWSQLGGTLREVTGYTSDPGETDSTPEIGAAGSNIYTLYQQGHKSCATNDYAFGTVLWIEGYGTCVVRDRMAKKNDGKVDIYFGKDRERALEFGRRILNVKVL